MPCHICNRATTTRSMNAANRAVKCFSCKHKYHISCIKQIDPDPPVDNTNWECSDCRLPTSPIPTSPPLPVIHSSPKNSSLQDISHQSKLNHSTETPASIVNHFIDSTQENENESNASNTDVIHLIESTQENENESNAPTTDVSSRVTKLESIVIDLQLSITAMSLKIDTITERLLHAADLIDGTNDLIEHEIIKIKTNIDDSHNSVLFCAESIASVRSEVRNLERKILSSQPLPPPELDRNEINQANHVHRTTPHNINHDDPIDDRLTTKSDDINLTAAAIFIFMRNISKNEHCRRCYEKFSPSSITVTCFMCSCKFHHKCFPATYTFFKGHFICSDACRNSSIAANHNDHSPIPSLLSLQFPPDFNVNHNAHPQRTHRHDMRDRRTADSISNRLFRLAGYNYQQTTSNKNFMNTQSNITRKKPYTNH